MKLLHIIGASASFSQALASLTPSQERLDPILPAFQKDIAWDLLAPQSDASRLSPKLRRELLGLHKHIVEIESLSGNELKIGQWLEKYLTNKGFSVERQKVEEGRYNVYAWGGDEEDKGKEEVLVSSHIDTVS